ncbi:MAG TPA: hypothetical protein VFJ47_15630 [Terriglobales bacterium]|nr:hypothetical protein [Terriglobales bacterium]
MADYNNYANALMKRVHQFEQLIGKRRAIILWVTFCHIRRSDGWEDVAGLALDRIGIEPP